MMIASQKFAPIHEKVIEFGGGLSWHQVPGIGLLLVHCNCFEHWPRKARAAWLEDLSFVDLADILQGDVADNE